MKISGAENQQLLSTNRKSSFLTRARQTV